MPQKPKASGGPRKTGAASKAKTQPTRFIEAARAIGVDESGREFERALRKIAPPNNAMRKKGRGRSS